MRKYLISALGVVTALLALVLLPGQVPSTNPPFNTDLGNMAGLITTTAITTAGTSSTAQQTNLDKRGVICALNVTTSSGSASAQFIIQGFDSASGQYYTLADSGVFQVGTQVANTLKVISTRVANQTSSLPTGWGASTGLQLPRLWGGSLETTGKGGPRGFWGAF